MAKRCVIDQKFQLTGGFIESMQFIRKPQGDRGPFWLVTRAYSREINGGQACVRVFGDRRCEVTYGD